MALELEEVSKMASFSWENKTPSYEAWLNYIEQAFITYSKNHRIPHKIDREIKDIFNEYHKKYKKDPFYAVQHTAENLKHYFQSPNIKPPGFFARLFGKQNYLYNLQERALKNYFEDTFESHLTKVKIQTNQKDLAEIKQKLEALTQSIDRKRQKIKELKEKLQEAQDKFKQTNELLTQEQQKNFQPMVLQQNLLKEVQEKNRLQDNVTNLESQLSEAEKAIKEQQINLDAYEKKIKDQERALNNLQGQLDKVCNVRDEVQGRLDKVSAAKDEANDKIIDLEYKLKQKETIVNQDLNAALPNENKLKTKVDELTQENDKFKSENKALKEILNSVRAFLITLFSKDPKPGKCNLELNKDHVTLVNNVLSFDPATNTQKRNFLSRFFGNNEKPKEENKKTIVQDETGKQAVSTPSNEAKDGYQPAVVTAQQMFIG